MNLEEITLSHRAAFMDFVADVRANDPPTFARWFAREWTEVTFVDFVSESERARLDWRPKANQISTTTYVAVDDRGIAGYGLLRFPLEPKIEADGGNFVFVVRPSRRREGLGPVVLNRLLFEGARAGLARAFVTCDADDAAARRCIAYNRGVSAGPRGSRESFWIPLR